MYKIVWSEQNCRFFSVNLKNLYFAALPLYPLNPIASHHFQPVSCSCQYELLSVSFHNFHLESFNHNMFQTLDHSSFSSVIQTFPPVSVNCSLSSWVPIKTSSSYKEIFQSKKMLPKQKRSSCKSGAAITISSFGFSFQV